MKKIKFFLAAFAAMATGGLYAQTDAEYEAAHAEIEKGGVYKIYTLSNGTETGTTKYYLKTDGRLTDDASAAGEFTFTIAYTSGGFKPEAFRLNKFTNGGSQNNEFSGESLTHIMTTNQDREDYEAQVFFKNSDGYAIRSTNAVSSSWGASAFWDVVAVAEADVPNATYTMDHVPFVWQLEKITSGLYHSVTTKYITNYNPAANGDGWTLSATPSYDSRNNVAEYWNHQSARLSQTLTIAKAGFYELTAIALTREGYTTTLYAGNASMPIATVNRSTVDNLDQAKSWFNNKNGRNVLTFAVTEDNTEVEIGLLTGTSGDAWTVWRAFYLGYSEIVPEAEITSLIAKIPTEGTIPSATYSNLTSLKGTLESEKSIDAYNALQSAITEAEKIAANYNRFKTVVKPNVLALKNQTTKFTDSEGDDSFTTLDSDIAAAETALEAATTVDEVNAAITLLRRAGSTFASSVSLIKGEYLDLTDAMLYNAGMREDGGLSLWNIVSNTNPSYPKYLSGKCSEFWNANFDFNQTAPMLPIGNYNIEVYAFHRAAAEGSTYHTYLYAQVGETTNQVLVLPITNGENNMTDAANSFDKGLYLNSLKVTLDEASNVVIGFKNEDTAEDLRENGNATDKWTIFRDFKIKYFGNDALAVYRDEYETALAAAEAALIDDTYTNVGGNDRSNLQTAVSTTYPKTVVETDETQAKFEEATTNLTNLTTTFKNGVTSWNAYVTAIADAASEKAKADALNTSIYTTALGSAPNTAEEAAAKAASLINDIKVGEYNYVVDNYTTAIKLGDWTQEGGTKFNYGKQHWSGDDSQGYWEQTTENYLSSNWSISFNQTIELPAGNYVFKVAGRHSGSSKMALEVTNADTDEPIGSVNDFPTGDTGKGIATDGTANFTDGTFANNGNGRGWQWRYVPFTLEGTTNVTVAVTASAAVQYQWISFCNYTVQAIPNAAVSIIAYNQALDEAKAARDNDAYANVTGSERTALLAAIASDETLDKSDKDKIDAAKDELVSAMTAFINAKAAYDTYAEAKAKVYEELPYASPEKYAAIATAQEATATSAADATDKTSVIISAYRKYVESNALAEGVAGAENKTSLISDPNMEVTYDGTAHTFGAWQVFGQTNGSIQLLSSESFTDGEGNSNYKYADIYKSDNNAGIQQTLSDLAPGRYILTVTARANTTAGASFKIFAGAANAEIQRIGNSGGVFNRGWNDATLVFDVLTESDVNIGVQSGNGKDLWWSATRFRLARLGNVPVSIDENVDYAATEATSVDVTLARTIKADAWNTFVVPFDITNAELKAAFGNDVEVAEFSDGGASADAVTVSFTKMGTPAITANKPVLLKSSTAGTSYSFTNRSVVTGTTTIAGTYVDFVGTYSASTTITEGNYFISGNKLWKSSGATTINGTRAYIDAKNVASVRLFIDDVETGIEAINGVEAENGAIYNIAGQRLGKMQKGINIVNGKKIIK